MRAVTINCDSTLPGLTEICGVQKQEKSIQTISNKKHFMKNVKECRDVNRQKVSEQGAIVTHHTHFGPITPYES